jgi:hypothetical protein
MSCKPWDSIREKPPVVKTKIGNGTFKTCNNLNVSVSSIEDVCWYGGPYVRLHQGEYGKQDRGLVDAKCARELSEFFAELATQLS